MILIFIPLMTNDIDHYLSTDLPFERCLGKWLFNSLAHFFFFFELDCCWVLAFQVIWLFVYSGSRPHIKYRIFKHFSQSGVILLFFLTVSLKRESFKSWCSSEGVEKVEKVCGFRYICVIFFYLNSPYNSRVSFTRE